MAYGRQAQAGRPRHAAGWKLHHARGRPACQRGRSGDLSAHRTRLDRRAAAEEYAGPCRRRFDRRPCEAVSGHSRRPAACCTWAEPDRRSEEHTSELQSLMRISYAVFCLKTKNNNTTYTQLDLM